VEVKKRGPTCFYLMKKRKEFYFVQEKEKGEGTKVGGRMTFLNPSVMAGMKKEEGKEKEGENNL